MKLIASVLLFVTAAFPQAAANANKAYKTKEGRDGVAKTLDNPNRDKNQKPEEIIAAMNIAPGSTVADIGTGTGYMLPFLSKAVGPAGRVFGEDIAPDFLDRARAKVASDNLSNVTLVLGSETSATLPANTVNNILILDVYHHFDYPDKMLANISSALKPGGHLFIVDFYKKDRADHIRIERDDVVKEISSNGFRLIKTIDHTGNNQYMLTFEKPSSKQ
ncbi:MAG TPA: class I SAM-dependent methyltransferase [Bryobacteraceae bacterium]|nr:class I SAM-dependent methyltransferase [Bryobacteraceae bacterium]